MQFICDGSAATAQCDSRWFVFCDVLKALVVLHKWIEKNKENATGNELERALKRVNREDIINQCMHNVGKRSPMRRRKCRLWRSSEVQQ